MIRKSGNRFSEKIMLKQKITLESDSTQLNETLGSRMRRRIEFLSRSVAVAAFAVFGGVLLAPSLAASLPRIASMNVCTDQLLIPLADPEQILGLSRFSRDASQSFAADDARRYPILSGSAEYILVLTPDIAV